MPSTKAICGTDRTFVDFARTMLYSTDESLYMQITGDRGDRGFPLSRALSDLGKTHPASTRITNVHGSLAEAS